MLGGKDKECVVCREFCKYCIEGLYLFQNQCLDECPELTTAQVINSQSICAYPSIPIIQLPREDEGKVISLTKPFRLKAEVFSNDPYTITWDVKRVSGGEEAVLNHSRRHQKELVIEVG